MNVFRMQFSLLKIRYGTWHDGIWIYVLYALCYIQHRLCILNIKYRYRYRYRYSILMLSYPQYPCMTLYQRNETHCFNTKSGLQKQNRLENKYFPDMAHCCCMACVRHKVGMSKSIHLKDLSTHTNTHRDAVCSDSSSYVTHTPACSSDCSTWRQSSTPWSTVE